MRHFRDIMTVWRQAAVLAVFVAALNLPAPGAWAEPTVPTVRKAAFAGSFYPADAASLQKLVDGYLDDARKAVHDTPRETFAIIAPHAGYIYSGKIAGLSYNAVRNRGFTTVVLLGSSHRSQFNGIALYPSGSWETPLGRVPVDTAMAKRLSVLDSDITGRPDVFEQEHSLEVQLPFLQRTLKGFKIVPLLTGALDKTSAARLSEALARVIRESRGKVLIVVSSDMSHYHPYSEAVKIDSSTMRLIGQGDPDSLYDGMARKDNELCAGPAVVAMMMAARRNEAEVQLLGYANSGDTSGDRSRVVGYGSALFWQPDEKAAAGLSAAQKKRLLALSRTTLESVVKSGTIPDVDMKDRKLTDRSGVFVTLNSHGQLRGCIGYIRPQGPLFRAVMEMTAAAATKDPRFNPVTKEEIKGITIEISVLSPLKLITSVNDIRVGTHGLFMTKGNYSGLLLPQVATHYKWDRTEFLKNTCLKAGLPEDAWKDRETKIYVFTAQIFSE